MILTDNMNIRGIDISRYLEDKGIKHALSGYRFLFILIQLGIEDRTRLIKMTDMYNAVADMYGIEPNSIERAIRYSIKEFGMTSKEFIAKAVDDLLCDGLSNNYGQKNILTEQKTFGKTV